MPLMRWWGDTPVGQTIRTYSALIALTETLHLLGLTIFAGTILFVDLRLMDVGFVRHPASRISRELAPYTLGGLLLSIVSGVFILSSEARKCYESSFFWTKMALLVAALFFHFFVLRPVARTEPPPPLIQRRIVACLSLALWIGVALSGKLIGIYGDDLREEQDPFHEQRSSSGRCVHSSKCSSMIQAAYQFDKPLVPKEKVVDEASHPRLLRSARQYAAPARFCPSFICGGVRQQ